MALAVFSIGGRRAGIPSALSGDSKLPAGRGHDARDLQELHKGDNVPPPPPDQMLAEKIEHQQSVHEAVVPQPEQVGNIKVEASERKDHVGEKFPAEFPEKKANIVLPKSNEKIEEIQHDPNAPGKQRIQLALVLDFKVLRFNSSAEM